MYLVVLAIETRQGSNLKGLGSGERGESENITVDDNSVDTTSFK